jgi:hypothetical protein
MFVKAARRMLVKLSPGVDPIQSIQSPLNKYVHYSSPVNYVGLVYIKMHTTWECRTNLFPFIGLNPGHHDP